MAVNVAGLVGIIFFYIIITLLGALLTYRRHWLINIWNKIQRLFGKDISTENTTNNNNNNNQKNHVDYDTIKLQDGIDNEAVPKDEQSNDLALAGRSIGLFIGSFTLTAGWVGGSFVTGTAEEVYGKGLLWTQAPFAYSLSLLVGGIMFSKIMRRNNYVTMLDPFQHRYGYLIGSTLLIPAFVAELFWSLSLLTSLATILSVIVGIHMKISIIISTFVAVLYTMFGGLALLANTDLIQLTLIFISLWVCVPIILSHKNVENISTHFSVWKYKEPLQASNFLVWFDNAIYLVFGGIPWQTYFQKILSCKSTKIAFYLSFTSSIFCMIMAIPPLLIGAAASVTNWEHFNLSNHTSIVNNNNVKVPKAEYVLPVTFVSLLPSTFLFICLGSLAASTLSSTDSSMLSAATMISHNLYKNVIRTKASNRELSIVLRLVTVIIGVLAIGLSFAIKSVYDLWFLSADLAYIILFPRLCTVTYFKFTNSYGAIIGSIISVLLRFLFGEPILKIAPIIKLPPFHNGNESQFPFKTFTMVVGLFVDIVISWIVYQLFVIKRIDPKYDILNMLKSPDFRESNSIDVISANNKKEPRKDSYAN